MRVAAAGALFGAGLSMKLIGIIHLPLAALILWPPRSADSFIRIEAKTDLRGHGCPRPGGRFLGAVGVFAASMALTFLAIVLLIDGGAFLQHFWQTWTAHFARAATSDYGTPDTHRFPPLLLLKNWDLTVPAAVGVVLLVRNSKCHCIAALPVVWLALMLTVFALHKPWWSYYYVHIAVPLSWCAACGITAAAARILNRCRSRRLRPAQARAGRFLIFRSPVVVAVASAYFLCTVAWFSARVWLQITEIRKAPRTYHALVLAEMNRYRPFTGWMYTDNLAYSFHAGIPVPPTLAILSLKRFWSGDMTHERVEAELRRFAPGLIALQNDSREVPFQELLEAEYRLVYYDAENRLFAHRTIAQKPDL
jgi:hypothetical protein